MQSQSPSIFEWPYTDIIARFNSGDRSWRETSEPIFWDQLGSVPPACSHGDAFAVGEAWTHSEDGPIHAVFCVVEGRFFCRLVPLVTFDPPAFQSQIRKQFHLDDSDPVFTCAECRQEKSQDVIVLHDGKITCEDCFIECLNKGASYKA